jgi:hypothetical protein
MDKKVLLHKIKCLVLMSDNIFLGVQSKPPYGRHVLIDWEYVSVFTHETICFIIDILMEMDKEMIGC